MEFLLNDYSELCHPAIMEAMAAVREVPETGYYTDSHSRKARELIQAQLGDKQAAAIHFVVGGTPANTIAISAFLRPHEAVIAPHSGHIAVHETGAIEATGHKILTVDSSDGKLTPAQIQTVLDIHTDEHMVKPRMVFMTNATEVGSVYTLAELKALHEICQANELLLYCDGARLGSALMSPACDITLPDLARYTDAFYIGGTKNGALLGEAMIIMNPTLAPDFRYLIKQRGSMLAKGSLVGIQFETLFTNNLFFDLAEHANQMAQKVSAALAAKGYAFFSEPQSNQIFPIFSEAKIAELSQDFMFMRWEQVDADQAAVRLVTSWATKEDMIDRFIAKL